MRTLLAATFFALVLALLPAAALAQDASPPSDEALRPPSLRIGAGAALPVSDGLSFFHGAGPSVAAGLDVPLSDALDVTLDASYTRLLLNDEDFLDPIERRLSPEFGDVDFDLSGGANNLIAGTVGLKWTFATPGRAALYLSGGTGLFYSTIGDIDVEARDVDGNPLEGDGDASLRSGEEGASFGFDLGAGVRLPLGAGADLFVEPRYALFLDDSHYFAARAGVAFDGLFEAAAPVRQREARAGGTRRYEVSAGYRGTFFGDGDETGASYRLSVARHVFSSRTGVALSGAYRRAVDTDLQEGLSWTKRRGMAADLTFFVDALRFDTGSASHHLRIGAGPAVRRQWGEAPRSLRFDAPGRPVDVERWLDASDRDHVYSGPIDGRTRYLFTEEFDETQWGGAVELEYALTFDGVTVGPRAGYWYYGEGSPAMSYGLHVGVPFGALVE